MINFNEINFGCSDASTEATRYPDSFLKVFFDPHNYLDELIEKDRFVLSGRKGDGKTAYGEQIILRSNQYNIDADRRTLNSFNNEVFDKLKTYGQFEGNQYIVIWQSILLIECVKMLNKLEPNIQKTEFVEIFSALNKHGFLSDDKEISITVKKLIESDTTLSVETLSHGRKYQHEETLRGAEQIYSAIKRAIKDLYFERNRVILILDGLDDLLNNSSFDAKIITGLIRAIDFINRDFYKSTLKLKIIVLIREDMLNLCRDPNISKIIRDSGIKLSWKISPHDEITETDLIRLASKRMDEIVGVPNSFCQVWDEIFPSEIDGKSSINYVLNNIIFRPRDILQFFIEVQGIFRGRKLSEDDVENALHSFSSNYFISAMNDELTGFLPDEAVTQLTAILANVGGREFDLNDFSNECDRYKCFDSIDRRDILRLLYNDGYIGQQQPRQNNPYTAYSYIHTNVKYDETHKWILHRGLMRGLAFS